MFSVRASLVISAVSPGACHPRWRGELRSFPCHQHENGLSADTCDNAAVTAPINRAVEQSSVAYSEVQEARTVLRNDVESVGALRNGTAELVGIMSNVSK